MKSHLNFWIQCDTILRTFHNLQNRFRELLFEIYEKTNKSILLDNKHTPLRLLGPSQQNCRIEYYKTVVYHRGPELEI